MPSWEYARMDDPVEGVACAKAGGGRAPCTVWRLPVAAGGWRHRWLLGADVKGAEAGEPAGRSSARG